jgi:hypothetical protein
VSDCTGWQNTQAFLLINRHLHKCSKKKVCKFDKCRMVEIIRSTCTICKGMFIQCRCNTFNIKFMSQLVYLEQFNNMSDKSL